MGEDRRASLSKLGSQDSFHLSGQTYQRLFDTKGHLVQTIGKLVLNIIKCYRTFVIV